MDVKGHGGRPLFQTISPDECLEAITILSKCGGTEAMKEKVFARLKLEGEIPSEHFFVEVKKALIVIGAVRAFGLSRETENYLLLNR